jgi:predicted O-methyltransferase YrrM
MQAAGAFFPHGHRPHKPWVVPPDLEADSRPWARTLVDVYRHPLSWPTCIAPEGGMLLQALIRNIQPETVVEAGTALGASTIWLSSGLQANGRGALWTYDLFVPPKDPDRHDHPLFNPPFENVAQRLTDAGVRELVTMRRGDSAANIAEDAATLRERGGVQFAFIDGDHSPKGILADFAQLEPLLAVGGYLVLHDVYPDLSHQVGPRWLLDNLTEHARGRYEVCDLYLAQTNYGMTVLRRTA